MTYDEKCKRELMSSLFGNPAPKTDDELAQEVYDEARCDDEYVKACVLARSFNPGMEPVRMSYNECLLVAKVRHHRLLKHRSAWNVLKKLCIRNSSKEIVMDISNRDINELSKQYLAGLDEEELAVEQVERRRVM